MYSLWILTVSRFDVSMYLLSSELFTCAHKSQTYCTVHEHTIAQANNSLAHTHLPCTTYTHLRTPCTYTTLEDLFQRKTDESAVFTNSELSLKHVDVYGFDFDYTLVHYTKEVNKLIYELARDRLVEKLNVCVQLSLFTMLVCVLWLSRYDCITSLVGHTLTVLRLASSHNCSI